MLLHWREIKVAVNNIPSKLVLGRRRRDPCAKQGACKSLARPCPGGSSRRTCRALCPPPGPASSHALAQGNQTRGLWPCRAPGWGRSCPHSLAALPTLFQPHWRTGPRAQAITTEHLSSCLSAVAWGSRPLLSLPCSQGHVRNPRPEATGSVLFPRPWPC